MTEFEGVVPALGQALEKRGYTDLTPVQLAVLEPELRTADMLVSAQTGSGKTVAFGLALAPTLLGDEDRFSRIKAPLALVVAPTRELALQVKRELEWLYEPAGAIVASCVGGMDMRDERRTLGRGAHIVVGTPGRLRDHIGRGSLDMTAMRAVVLDEADEMLDLGFREDLEFILEAAPEDRRTLMFSATVPRSIGALAKRYQRDAVRVQTASEKGQHVDIEYRALNVAQSDKENAIINVLRYFEAKNALVFCGTRAEVNRMTARFNNRGFAVVALSGELSQKDRTYALQAMRDGRARVCIATDVAARGIDLPNLELVIHADIPKNRESLLHRSGRTGRAGRKGTCVLIVPTNARRRTERLLSSANVTAEWAKAPSAEEVSRRDEERLLTDEMLVAPLTEDEQAFTHELLSQHGPEQVAAAFVRLYRKGQSAPEHLQEITVSEGKRERERKPRRQNNDFQNSVWFSLTIARERSPDPRWLLPMLCKAGNLSKDDIGAIRVQRHETYVEIEASSVEGFVKSIGPDQVLEKDIPVKRLDKMPDVLKGGRDGQKEREPRRSPYKDRKSSKPGGRSKPDYKAKRGGKPSRQSDDKPRSEPYQAKKPEKRTEEKPVVNATPASSPQSEPKPSGKKREKVRDKNSVKSPKKIGGMVKRKTAKKAELKAAKTEARKTAKKSNTNNKDKGKRTPKPKSEDTGSEDS